MNGQGKVLIENQAKKKKKKKENGTFGSLKLYLNSDSYVLLQDVIHLVVLLSDK